MIEQRELALVVLEDGLVEHAVGGGFLRGELRTLLDLFEEREVGRADLLAQRVVRSVDARLLVQQVDTGADVGRGPVGRIERKEQDDEGDEREGQETEEYSTEFRAHGLLGYSQE